MAELNWLSIKKILFIGYNFGLSSVVIHGFILNDYREHLKVYVSPKPLEYKVEHKADIRIILCLMWESVYKHKSDKTKERVTSCSNVSICSYCELDICFCSYIPLVSRLQAHWIVIDVQHLNDTFKGGRPWLHPRHSVSATSSGSDCWAVSDMWMVWIACLSVCVQLRMALIEVRGLCAAIISSSPPLCFSIVF